MAKRYLGGGVSFEQKDVYQEFSEDDGGGSSTLSGLTDVDISEPTDGQVLVYDATSQKWVNDSAGGGGGGSGTLVVRVVADGEDRRLDHTFAEISAAGYAVLWDVADSGGGEYMAIVGPLTAIGYIGLGSGSNPSYVVQFKLDQVEYVFTADTQDEYPAMQK